jgi:hypothetical protein
VHPGARVDLLLPVVRDVVHEAADDRVGLQARRGQRVVKDLRGGRLLHQELAAAAGPLAADLALHEELRRDDVQSLADVLAHAHHRLAAFGRWAMGVLGLDALLHARQMGRQWFALGLAFAVLLGLLLGCAAASASLQGGELGLQAGLVSGQGFFEDVALLGVHGFSPGAELPGFQARQLERDAFDLRVAPLDGLRLGVDAPALLADVAALLVDVSQHLRGDGGQFARAQRLEVLGFDRMHVEHAAIVQAQQLNAHRVFFQLLWIARCGPFHMRVIHRSCSSRCHGNPSTKALN